MRRLGFVEDDWNARGGDIGSERSGVRRERIERVVVNGQDEFWLEGGCKLCRLVPIEGKAPRDGREKDGHVEVVVFLEHV